MVTYVGPDADEEEARINSEHGSGQEEVHGQEVELPGALLDLLESIPGVKQVRENLEKEGIRIKRSPGSSGVVGEVVGEVLKRQFGRK
jgi:hypothetical protein